MLGFLHGYLLDGSGSNLWTRSVIQALCRQGRIVHLVCQEPHPERYDFIAEAYRYHLNGTVEPFHRRAVPYPGRAILHKPQIGDTLPVYVADRYEEFPRVVRMPELSTAELESYVARHVPVVRRLLEAHGVRVLHVNHVVLMSVVAQRATAGRQIPFAVMPHGSAIEYAVRPDARLRRLAESALAAAARILVVGPEMHQRICTLFGAVPDIGSKITRLNLGVDTSLFRPVARSRRAARIATLVRSLATLPRGRPAGVNSLTAMLSGEPDVRRYAATLREASSYWGQAPDTGVERALESVDWIHDQIVLFVGRLIATKGLAALLAAMPLIADAAPRARLLVVGHGPLREVAEALVLALALGRRHWVEAIVRFGSGLEVGAAPLSEVGTFLSQLDAHGQLERYFDTAARRMGRNRVIFTGYLRHRELRHLFPCCDVAVFPSLTPEAGPLVFLEALASGCWPIGTDFGGMRASIDAVSDSLPPQAVATMRLGPDPEAIAADMAAQVPRALGLPDRHQDALRRIAVERYDWTAVASRLATELEALARARC